MNNILSKVTQNKKICYVKSGITPPKRTTNRSGILFLANDWKVAGDVTNNMCFLFKWFSAYFAFTFLYTLHHPDMPLSLNWPVHAKKIWKDGKYGKSNKYELLVHTIKKNCWTVNLFGVEVGARRNPSGNILTYLRKLRFPHKLARST